MFNVLFVCSENTCRSPMAEYLFKHLLTSLGIKNVRVKSCGVNARENGTINPNTKAVLKQLGIKTHFKPRQITGDLVRESDLILTMTMGHKMSVALKYDCLNKLFTFGEYVGGEDVADPYGGSIAVYQQTANVIYGNLTKLITKLKKEGKI